MCNENRECRLDDSKGVGIQVNTRQTMWPVSAHVTTQEYWKNYNKNRLKTWQS